MKVKTGFHSTPLRLNYSHSCHEQGVVAEARSPKALKCTQLHPPCLLFSPLASSSLLDSRYNAYSRMSGTLGVSKKYHWCLWHVVTTYGPHPLFTKYFSHLKHWKFVKFLIVVSETLHFRKHVFGGGKPCGIPGTIPRPKHNPSAYLPGGFWTSVPFDYLSLQYFRRGSKKNMGLTGKELWPSSYSTWLCSWYCVLIIVLLGIIKCLIRF